MNFCEKRKTFCKRRHHTQLTEQELSTMKRYVMTKKYAHVSISSLHLLAQRKGKLFCSLDTWYKYVRIFEWKRPWQKSKKYRAYSGIKTKQINEIWHIDVTVVKVRPDIKLYIQAVIDNYSRYVLAWRVTKEINAENTVTTLKLAKQNAAKIVKQSVKPTVMMDPGTENANFRVLNFLSSKNLSRLLAQVDVRYSNSMIESLFRMFKNNYFYHQRIDGIDDLVRKAYFYFTQHNNFIPLAVHQGGRPCEIYTSTWNHDARNRLDKQKLDAKDERKKRNLSPACVSCPIPPHRGP
ncbi:MAG: transposase, partial [Proteobacteria bacterium]